MKLSCLLNSRAVAVWCLLGALYAGAASAQAQPAPEGTALDDVQLRQRAQARVQERSHIQGLRHELKQRREVAEKGCWGRFAVEDCLRDVRAQAREQDDQLRERELRINSEERADKADARLRSIAQKQQEKRMPQPVQAQSRTQALPVTAPAPMPQVPEAVPEVPQLPASPEVGAADAPARAAAPSPEQAQDVQAVQRAREMQAQERAAAQAQRVQQQRQVQAQSELSDAQRRDRVKKSMESKQQSAQERRDRKAPAIAGRKGDPLPIPAAVKQP